MSHSFGSVGVVALAANGVIAVKPVVLRPFHGSEVGGVEVDIEQAAVKDAYEDLITWARYY